MSITKEVKWTIVCTRCHAMEHLPAQVVAKDEPTDRSPHIEDFKLWVQITENEGDKRPLVWELCPNCRMDWQKFLDGRELQEEDEEA